MKFNAQTARENTTKTIQKNLDIRKAQATNCVNEVIVPIIEKAIEKGYFKVFVLKEKLDGYNCDTADCYVVLMGNGFEVTNYKTEFLIEW